MQPYFVCVHAGAGFHSHSREAEYSQALADACRAAGAALRQGGSPAEAVEAAIKLLEDSPACNAGRGSNLSMQGLVECDASMMAGDGAFGAVGAAPGITNPISAAALLAAESRQPLSHGRVRPMMLAGDRAREWALSRGLPAAASASEAASMHVTQASQQRWEKYQAILAGSPGGASAGKGSRARSAQAEAEQMQQGLRHLASSSGVELRQQQPQQQQQQQHQHQHQQQQQREGKRRRLANGSLAAAPAAAQRGLQNSHHLAEEEEESWALDTVGCIAVNAQGRVAAGVSSGGIALKAEGRVGEAAVFGAGCWAQDATTGACVGSCGPSSNTESNSSKRDGRGAMTGEEQQQPYGLPAVAVSVSGVGEHIMRHLLARECGLRLSAAAAAAAAAAETAATEAQGNTAAAAAAPPPALAAAAAAAAAAPGADGVAQVQEAAEEDQSGAPVSQVAAALLQQTMLRGPPPHDCGIIALTATLEEASHGQGRAGSGGYSAAEAKAGQSGPATLCVELGVAHCAQSLAVAYASHHTGSGQGCGHSHSSSKPVVTFLRQQHADTRAANGVSGASVSVVELLHGVCWQLPLPGEAGFKDKQAARRHTSAGAATDISPP